MHKKSVYYFIGLIVFCYFFAVFDVKFRGPDEPIYFAYTASVIDDGDLNAIDQFYSGKAEYASKTYNLPDFHNHGGTVLWAPAYAYGKSFNLAQAPNCALSFSTVIFAFFALLITFALCSKLFSSGMSLWSCVLMFFATPYFYFTFFQPGNGQIIASLFSVISIFTLYYASGMSKWRWFTYGIFFSACVAIKLDLWFQGFLIVICFFMLLRRKEADFSSVLFFVAGFLPIFVCNLINDYIKYGVLRKGEFFLFNPHNFYLFDQLFSSYRGYFYTSPVFYLSLFGFLLLAVSLLRRITFDPEDVWKERFLLLLGMYLFIKIFIISFRFAWGGGTVGARHLLTELPVFVLLYAYALEKSGKLIRYIIYVLSILLALWNLLVIAEFIRGLDMQYLLIAPPLSERIVSLKAIFALLTQPKELLLKFTVLTPLLLVLSVIIIASALSRAKITQQEKVFKVMGFLAVYSFMAYATITGMNIRNNSRNVESLKNSGFFEKTLILSPRHYERGENLVSMDEMIYYFGLKNNTAMTEKIRQVRKEIYGDGEAH